jgi:hypothetical protein
MATMAASSRVTSTTTANTTTTTARRPLTVRATIATPPRARLPAPLRAAVLGRAPPSPLGRQQLPAAAAGPPPPQRVLPLLASAVEASASLSRYEQLAGRSAMIGIAAAAVLEAASGGGVLSHPPPLPEGPLAAAALAVLGAAAAAVASTARSPASLGARWREPVVASLTAVRRANAGVTPSWRLRGLDRAVDEAMRGLGGGALEAAAALSSSSSWSHLASSDSADEL